MEELHTFPEICTQLARLGLSTTTVKGWLFHDDIIPGNTRWTPVEPGQNGDWRQHNSILAITYAGEPQWRVWLFTFGPVGRGGGGGRGREGGKGREGKGGREGGGEGGRGGPGEGKGLRGGVGGREERWKGEGGREPSPPSPTLRLIDSAILPRRLSASAIRRGLGDSALVTETTCD